MRLKLIGSMLLVPVLALAGCQSLGLSDGSFATRVLAGLNCVTAITAAGGVVAADPDLGVSTVTDALNAINKVASGPALQTALAACQDTFKYIAQDSAGLKSMVESKGEPAPQRKARMARVSAKAQADPVVVKVPLR